MDMSLSSKLAIVAATAGAFFALGAYYQHQHVVYNIKRLEQRNPHAYVIRRKLYALLDIFKVKAVTETSEDDDDYTAHKMGGIMKYGFPSMNEISLNETHSFVTAFDRRNSAIQWMCERVNEDSYMNTTRLEGQIMSMRRRARGSSSNRDFQQSEAARVFFMSNIKPFLNRGFNLSVWERLLQYVNSMAQVEGAIFVYTGSIHLPRQMMNNWFLEFQTEDNAVVAIPTHFFKVIVVEAKRDSSIPYAEAYVVPNAIISDDTELQTLLCDVRDIENSTGLKFFDGLDRNFVNTQNTSSTELIEVPQGGDNPSNVIAC